MVIDYLVGLSKYFKHFWHMKHIAYTCMFIFAGYIRLLLIFSSLLFYDSPKWFLCLYIISVTLDGKALTNSLLFLLINALGFLVDHKSYK